MLLNCNKQLYINSDPLIQNFDNNTIIFHNNKIIILNITGDKEVEFSLNLINNKFPHMKQISNDLNSNNFTNMLINEYQCVSMFNNYLSDYNKKNMIWTVDLNNKMQRCIQYIVYIASVKEDINLLSNNCEKFNNLIYLITSMPISLNIKNDNIFKNKFHENLYKNIGAPCKTIYNIDGKELYVYVGCIPNATICFLLQLNNRGLPISYMYSIICTEKTIKGVLVYDDSMIIKHNNKFYNINNIPNTKGIYIIYVSRYFEIS